MSARVVEWAPSQRLDPVVYLQHSDLVSNVFDRLPTVSDWHSCSLVSKQWMQVNAERNPRKVLVRAIDGNQYEIVVALLNQGLSPKFRIRGARFVSCAETTPYLLAQSLGRKAIAFVLKEKEGMFSEEMVKRKLQCLRFGVTDFEFSVQGVVFQQRNYEGVGHDFHHRYLIPEVISSLKAYLNQRADTSFWNQAKSEQLLTALQQSQKICRTCAPKEFAEHAKKMGSNELIIFSDTEAYDHTHWVNFAVKNSYFAIGNRGMGCKSHPGAQVYKRDVPFDLELCSSKHLKDLNPSSCTHYVKFSFQNLYSCSRKSLEAIVLGSIDLLLCEDLEAQGKKIEKGMPELHEAEGNAISIVQGWLEFEQELGLERLMNDRTIAHDQDLYVRFLASLSVRPEVAEKFYHFLRSKGPIPWLAISKNYKLPCDYVPSIASPIDGEKERNYRYLDGLFLRLVCDAKVKYNPEDSGFWNSQIDFMMNNVMRGFDVQNRKIVSYATLERSSKDRKEATGGLLVLFYDMDSKECSICMALPVKRRIKVLNAFLCCLQENASLQTKFAVRMSQYLPEQKHLGFSIQLPPCRLDGFLKELRQAYGKKDLVEKYTKDPRLSKTIKDLNLETAASDAADTDYYLRLCKYTQSL